MGLWMDYYVICRFCFLKVLGMDLIMNLPIKVSTTTSNFMIGVTADTSSILYFKAGYIDFILLPFLTWEF